MLREFCSPALVTHTKLPLYVIFAGLKPSNGFCLIFFILQVYYMCDVENTLSELVL
jgi:hypothetical protein